LAVVVGSGVSEDGTPANRRGFFLPGTRARDRSLSVEGQNPPRRRRPITPETRRDGGAEGRDRADGLREKGRRMQDNGADAGPGVMMDGNSGLALQDPK